MTDEATWKAEYARLALATHFDLTAADAAQEADNSWDDLDQVRGDNPMPPPADALREDMLDWMTR